MHELPHELTSSLRSFRGSIYGSSRASAHRDPDLEKGEVQRQSGRQDGDDISRAASEAKGNSSKHHPDGADKEVGKQKSSSHLSGKGKKAAPQRPAVDTKNTEAKDPQSPTPKSPPKLSVFNAPQVDDPDPAADRLDNDDTPLSDEDFHQLMGMRKPTSTREERHEEKNPFELATERGLYRTIREKLRWIEYRYRVFDVMTYVLLGLQILLGAGFIILGALRDIRTYIAIAVLGAISTVVGGVLALMKGQGLPNRLRQARNQMSNVVFEAEELYWDFRSGRPIIYSDIKKIRKDYLRVLEEMRKNHPDTWTSAASQIAETRRGKRARD